MLEKITQLLERLYLFIHLLIHHLFTYLFKNLYWSIIALQWYVSFCFITK